MTEEQYLHEYAQVWEFMNCQTGEVTWDSRQAREWARGGNPVDFGIIDVKRSEFPRMAKLMDYKPLD